MRRKRAAPSAHASSQRRPSSRAIPRNVAPSTESTSTCGHSSHTAAFLQNTFRYPSSAQRVERHQPHLLHCLAHQEAREHASAERRHGQDQDRREARQLSPRSRQAREHQAQRRGGSGGHHRHHHESGHVREQRQAERHAPPQEHHRQLREADQREKEPLADEHARSCRCWSTADARAFPIQPPRAARRRRRPPRRTAGTSRRCLRRRTRSASPSDRRCA